MRAEPGRVVVLTHGVTLQSDRVEQMNLSAKNCVLSANDAINTTMNFGRTKVPDP